MTYSGPNAVRLHPIVFSETKPQLDPTRLAIVASLQDDATRQVLQTAYLKVPAMAHR